ncbi:hypothetical protein XU18_2918 [Perkinsela sp. CCAP 1560/4]|nr:hypothetical protein XU18_2918 [Perkinsela sp. CCAP 1560/4]|eukprot:KNH06413.1 hypothetical protein XU18_2918 [Perkinsela sp. CCAP 1560/4]
MSIAKIATAQEFRNLLSSNIRVVVKFEADWCGPCKVFAPTYENMAKANAGSISFGKVDVDEANEVAMMENISCMPTIKTYLHGKVQETILGADKDKVQAAIDSLLKTN